MKHTDKIENTNIGIYVDEHELIFQKEGKVIKYNLENSNEEVLFQTDFKTHTIERINKSIFLISSSGFLRYENGQTVFYKRQIGDYKIKDKMFLFTSLDRDYEKHLSLSGCIDIFTNQVIWSGEYGEQLKSNKGNTYSISQTKLAKRNLSTGAIEWHYDIDKTTYWSTLYIGKYYVLLAIPERDLLVCFEASTGNKLWEQKTIPKGIIIDKDEISFHQFMVNYSQFSLRDATLLNNRNDSLYFKEIGIQNQKDNYLQLGNSLLINDSRTRKTGKFNTKKLEFDYIHEGLGIPPGYTMRCTENYACLIDQNKILNIFKWNTG